MRRSRGPARRSSPTPATKAPSTPGAGGQDLGNPLRLRRALDHGVRVIVAHCASVGNGVDLDVGPNGPRVGNFSLFARLMEDPRYARLLHGDISALVQRNRAAVALAALLTRADWHGRLLWGSDYPLPGVMPLINVHAIAGLGLLDPREVPVIVGDPPTQSAPFRLCAEAAARRGRAALRPRGLRDA